MKKGKKNYIYCFFKRIVGMYYFMCCLYLDCLCSNKKILFYLWLSLICVIKSE